MNILEFIVLGMSAGLLAGAFGVGGGIVLVPVLIIIFKLPLQTAVGTSLVVIIATSITGAIQHWNMKHVNYSIAFYVALGGIIGAILGPHLLKNIPPYYAKKMLALLLIYSAFRLWLTK